MQIGGKFYGSPSLQTSTENQELVPERTAFYKFSFSPKSNCTVMINDSEPILIESELGFNMNQVDAYISSFIIVDSGIEYSWIGGSK